LALKQSTGAIFGYTISDADLEHLEGVMDVFMKQFPLLYLLPVLERLSFGPAQRLKEQIRVLDELIHRVRHRLSLVGTREESLFQRLVDIKSEGSGERLSTKQVRDEVATLLLAGHETTAVTMGWALYQLGKAPEIQGRIREELRELCAAPSLTPDELDSVVETNQFLDEVMRLYAPVPIVVREALEDVEFGGERFPRGTVLMTAPYVVHRHPQFWSRPDEFIPSRFADHGVIHPTSFLPFGWGPRKCIGNRFARYEMILNLAAILHRCRIDLMTTPEVKQCSPGATLRPTPQVPLRIFEA
jgi:cytochrome P450